MCVCVSVCVCACVCVCVCVQGAELKPHTKAADVQAVTWASITCPISWGTHSQKSIFTNPPPPPPPPLLTRY